MIWKYAKHMLMVIVLVMSTITLTQAQFVSSTIWMKISEVGTSGTDSLTFGTHQSANYTLDTPLGENIAPPPAPGGLDVVFGTLPGRVDPAWDRGLIHKCLYNFVSETKKDTFILKINDNDAAAGGLTVLFEWPDSAYLAARCDSIFLRDQTNQIPTPNVNMMHQQSMSVDGMFGIPVNQMRIYRYGVKQPYVDAVHQTSPLVPEGFALSQNYPNPFNPTTTLKFDVQSSAFTDVSVYNMLGQKVTTLVARQLTPGTYTTEWNGTNAQNIPVTSGVYFARMSATSTGSNGLTQSFSAVRKLVFMK